MQNIIKHTDHKDKKLVRDFLSSTEMLPRILGGTHTQHGRTRPTQLRCPQILKRFHTKTRLGHIV